LGSRSSLRALPAQGLLDAADEAAEHVVAAESLDDALD
jgi:hypothetical protein